MFDSFCPAILQPNCKGNVTFLNDQGSIATEILKKLTIALI